MQKFDNKLFIANYSSKKLSTRIIQQQEPHTSFLSIS